MYEMPLNTSKWWEDYEYCFWFYLISHLISSLSSIVTWTRNLDLLFFIPFCFLWSRCGWPGGSEWRWSQCRWSKCDEWFWTTWLRWQRCDDHSAWLRSLQLEDYEIQRRENTYIHTHTHTHIYKKIWLILIQHQNKCQHYDPRKAAYVLVGYYYLLQCEKQSEKLKVRLDFSSSTALWFWLVSFQ